MIIQTHNILFDFCIILFKFGGKSMDNKSADKNSILSERDFFQTLKTEGCFDIKPCNDITNIEVNDHFKKLNITPAQKRQVGSLISQLPAVVAAGNIADIAKNANMSDSTNLYRLVFPDGLYHTLVELRQGGFSSTYLGETGHFAGTASLYPVENVTPQTVAQLTSQAAILGTFTAMSIASGQYFLTQINSELKHINQSMDRILEFLYGDKKAELMAEVSFAKYAYQNYESIMSHGSQVSATIAGLQGAKKIAMKDSEFYISDLNSTVNSKDNPDIISMVNKAVQIKESLELAMQLYVMSNLLEVYYAQNYDTSYLQYVERDVSTYIDKCEKNMLSSFSAIKMIIQSVKGKKFIKLNLTELQKLENTVNKVVDSLSSGGESKMCKSLYSALYSSIQKNEYYLSTNGSIYLKQE